MNENIFTKTEIKINTNFEEIQKNCIKLEL
jgi:hypothetical protein